MTMTTEVPAGTTEQDLEGILRHEAAHSRELAASGNLRRLWRLPLNPANRLDLFAAEDADRLEMVLRSIPLRQWRTDKVESLSPSPNDPELVGLGAGQEFMITMSIVIPGDTPHRVVDKTLAREAQHVRDLAKRGHLKRLWALQTETNERRRLGLWNANHATEMNSIVESLPLNPWMTHTISPLTRHPSDPAGAPPA